MKIERNRKIKAPSEKVEDLKHQNRSLKFFDELTKNSERFPGWAIDYDFELEHKMVNDMSEFL